MVNNFFPLCIPLLDFLCCEDAVVITFELDTTCQVHAVQAKLSARYTGMLGLIS